MASGLAFNSLNHFELIFVYSGYHGKFHALHEVVQYF